MKFLKKPVILVLIILLTACSPAQEIDNTIDIPSSDNVPNDISQNDIPPINKEIITIPVCAEQIPGEDAVESINEVLESKYNVNFKYTLKRDITQADVANFDGLVFLRRDKFFEFFTNRAEIMLPMTDILSEIEEWSYLPDKFQKAFTQLDNENWAIPAGEAANPFFPARSYNSDILSSLNMKIPSNTDELMRLLEQVKEYYPDVIPMMLPSDSVLYNSSDILSAFGVPAFLSGKYFSQIAYYDSTGGYEDIVMHENFMEAITFLKNLYSYDLVNISDYSYKTRMNLFNEGSVFTRFGYLPMSDDEISDSFSPEYGSYLLNDNYDLPKTYENITSPMIVLGGNTKEPQKLLEALINDFYSNQEGIRDVSYGLVELNEYEISDKSVFKSIETQDIKFLPMNISSLLDVPAHSEALNNKQALNDFLRIKTDYINSMPNENQLQGNNFYHAYISQYSTDKITMFNHLNALVVEFIKTNMSSEEFMERYVATMKNINAEDMINNYNKTLGLTEFYY